MEGLNASPPDPASGLLPWRLSTEPVGGGKRSLALVVDLDEGRKASIYFGAERPDIYWWLWDENGIGGENDTTENLEVALRDAEAAVHRAGWSSRSPTPPSGARAGELAWLLEYRGVSEEHGLVYRPWWLTIHENGPAWTPNANDAIRFSRREDAERAGLMLAAQCAGPLIATEHSWFKDADILAARPAAAERPGSSYRSAEDMARLPHMKAALDRAAKDWIPDGCTTDADKVTALLEAVAILTKAQESPAAAETDGIAMLEAVLSKFGGVNINTTGDDDGNPVYEIERMWFDGGSWQNESWEGPTLLAALAEAVAAATGA